MSDLSRDKLIAFLDWTAEKGMMKRTTARALRSACNTVLSVMDDDEASDVSKVDLQSIVQRYQNLHSLDVSPNTMQTYGRRVRQAVDEFLRFNEDQAGWKPAGVQRSRTPTQSSSKRRRSSRSLKETEAVAPSTLDDNIDVSEIVHQFPLRRDAIVTVKGIPFDVKKSEMARLNAFLSNLVAVSEELEKQQLMLMPASGDE